MFLIFAFFGPSFSFFLCFSKISKPKNCPALEVCGKMASKTWRCPQCPPSLIAQSMLWNGQPHFDKEQKHSTATTHVIYSRLFLSVPEKGLITKGVFSMEESLGTLKSLDSLESLENGQILLCFPESRECLESPESLGFSDKTPLPKHPFLLIRILTVAIPADSRRCQKGFHSRVKSAMDKCQEKHGQSKTNLTAEQSLQLFGDVSGCFSNFELLVSLYVLECKTFRGDFILILQTCQPNYFSCVRQYIA